MRNTTANILASLLMATSLEASSLTIAEYQRVRLEASGDKYLMLRAYISGLSNGFEWMNATLIHKGQKPVFCAPMTIALNAENYMQMLDDALKRGLPRSKGQDAQIEMVLLSELEARLPCPS